MEEISAMTSKSSELCFSKEDFTSKDFSVDKFVSEYRKQTSLEIIKEDLGLFLKVLQSAMVELINKDYADFVNLSTNLVGLDKSIKNLSTPLGELGDEITKIQEKLDQSVQFLQKIIEERDTVHRNKKTLSSVMYVLEGIDNIEKQKFIPLSEVADNNVSAEMMERIAAEYNQIQYHMNLCADVQIIKEKEIIKEQISSNLLQNLATFFISNLTETVDLHRVLRIYSSIDKVTVVENLFRTEVVRPFMQQVIDEKLIAKEGIHEMYEKVLDFIPDKCAAILKVTRAGKRDYQVLKGFDFLVNSVWPEIILCLEYIGSCIFAPGNPKLFHKNYTASMNFINKFEHSCVVQASVKRLRQHQSYKTFMEKWNLAIYFEIRFQEIGGLVEASFSQPFSLCDDNEKCHLNATFAFWKAFHLCWDPDVCLQPLTHKFWKLTLQLFSRFYYWVNQVILDSKDYNLENRKSSSASIVHLVILVHDIEYITSEMLNFFNLKICSNFSSSLQKCAKDIVKEWHTLYDQIPAKIGNVIVLHLTADCSQHLKLITDIPRLYRKTNREVPSKPSTYVNLVFAPLDTFITDTKQLISEKWQAQWCENIINNVSEMCLSMTNDVLVSVRKMEDSLKRLKKARDKPQGNTVTGTLSDDDKIRKQLVVDVEHLGYQMKQYGTSHETNIHFKKLEELVHSAMKTSNPNS